LAVRNKFFFGGSFGFSRNKTKPALNDKFYPLIKEESRETWGCLDEEVYFAGVHHNNVCIKHSRGHGFRRSSSPEERGDSLGNPFHMPVDGDSFFNHAEEK
jgi:hypothetical protein